MKIAFILPGGGRSGGIRNTVVVANHLLARGHEVRIFYHKNYITLRLMLRSMRNKVMYSGRYNWLEMFEGSMASFRDITTCEFFPDEIIVGVGMWSCAELGRLSFIHNPKLQYLRGITPWLQNRMEKAVSLNIPKVAVSSHVAEYVRLYTGGKDVLGIIPNGVKLEEYYPGDHQNERNGIGTMYGSAFPKDPDTILALLGRMRESLPNVPQYIFGLGPRPKEIPKRNYVRLPSVQEARRIYSRCKVWIVASRSEGFGMPILEAMACGCAVVATDCGGPRDIIKDGETGFLVQVGNVEQLFYRVKTLLADHKLRQKFIVQSKKTVKKFNWKNSIEQLEKVLRSIAVPTTSDRA